MQFKLFLRVLARLDDDNDQAPAWDDPLSQHLQSEWKKMIREAVLSPEIRLPVPADPDGPPHIVMFVDGSTTAYATIVYL